MSDANVVKLLQPGSFADPLTEVLRNGARALLVEMWNCYKGHTKTYGRNWVIAGCPGGPDGVLPGEHFTFTEKLKPFRNVVSAAPEEIRGQFLELTQTA